jgi:hypothetical protein
MLGFTYLLNPDSNFKAFSEDILVTRKNSILEFGRRWELEDTLGPICLEREVTCH